MKSLSTGARVALAGCSALFLTTACKRTPPEPAKPAVIAAAPRAPIGDRIAELVHLVNNNPQIAALNEDERLYETIRDAVITPWEKAWNAQDAVAFERQLTANASVPAWAGSERKLQRERDGLLEFTWVLTPASTEQRAKELSTYLSSFSRIEDFRLEVGRVTPTPEGARLETRFDLRAFIGTGLRRHDRGTMAVSVVNGEDGWRITGIEGIKLESLEASAEREPTFVDATVDFGLDKAPIIDRREALRRGGYAVAVADYDGDGRPDVLVGHWGPLTLYRNTENGFKDVTKEAGLRGETLVKAAAFADLDNDGHKDLIVLRFIEKPENRNVDDPMRGPSGDGDVIFYRNLGNAKFEHKGNVLVQNRHYDRTMPLALADFDGNGTLDVYVGFPGGRDFTNNLSGTTDSKFSKQGVWLNDGKWGFLEAPTDSDLVTDKGVYPHAALATDLNGDGRPDIIVADDGGAVNPIYLNAGGGKFTNITERSGLAYPGWGMGLTAGDIDGDGHIDIVMTNIDLPDAARFADSREGRQTDPELLKSLRKGKANSKGIAVFRNKGDGTFEEVSERMGLTGVGAAPAGAELVDFNNDGLLDLYVMNGLWSGGAEEAGSFFMRLFTVRENYGNDQTDAAMSLADVPGDPNPMLTIVREFKGSLKNPGVEISDKPTLSFAGHQRNRLFRNNGDGTFTEVGFLEGADRLEDGYMASIADFDGDGRQDILLRNADPAPGNSFPTVVLLRSGSKNRSLTVFAKGKESNRDGVGAVLTAWVGERRMVREIRSAAGAAQGETAAHFGLGDATKIERLQVKWPSGRVEEFENVKDSRVLLSEGDGYVALAAAAR